MYRCRNFGLKKRGYALSSSKFLLPLSGTPSDVVAKLNATVVEALADPAFRDRLSDLGVEIPAREQQTPAALRVHLKDEIDKWRPIIESANIKPD
jgi:tripartite-type tricarboxylate transporter receptor subunit TctC